MTNIQPKVAEISAVANDIYAKHLLKHLKQKDCGRSRSRYQSAIKEINKFNTTYQLGAEQYLKQKEGRDFTKLMAAGVMFLLVALMCSILWFLFVSLVGAS